MPLAAVLVSEFTSTPLLEPILASVELDAVHEFYRERCARVLERFSGSTRRGVGNRIIAEFHCDGDSTADVARVLEAALALRREELSLTKFVAKLRPDLTNYAVAVRCAAHAERFVATTRAGVAPVPRLDAIGEVAMRCLELSRPGQVVASQALIDLVPGLFLTGGIDNPNSEPRSAVVDRTSGVRSKPRNLALRSQTPFIGREVENDLLFDRWRRVSAKEGRSLVIRGEPGIGKSRLLSSFRERLGTRRYSWIEAHCSPEHQGSAFHPVAAFFETTLGIRRSDEPEFQLELLEHAMREAGFPLDETVPLFASLLGIELSGRYSAIRIGREEIRRETLDWLAEWVVRVAQEQPTAIIVDDLHWCDPSTLELVTRLIDLIRADNTQILLLLAARNEFVPPWHDIEQIQLPRFNATEVATMASAVAGARSLPRILTDEVALRSEGIPLFVEEFTEAILESESTSGTPAALLETSMLNRISRISRHGIAQLIAVVGQECSYDLLKRISVDCDATELDLELEKLVSAGVLEHDRDANGDRYTFAHALVRDALYDGLAEETRFSVHERIANALEVSISKSLYGRPEAIARHYHLTRDPRRAIAYYQQAAEAAVQVSAHAEAVLHLRNAISILNPSDEPASNPDADWELELLVTLGPSLLAIHGYGDPQVAEVFARAHRLCQGVSDPELLFRATYGLSAYFQAHGSQAKSGELSKDCLVLAEQIGDPALKILSHQRLGLTYLYAGAPHRSLAHFEKVLEFYDPAQHRPLAFIYGGDAGVVSRAYSAVAYFLVGRPDRARLSARAALADAREGGHQHTIAFALCFCGTLFHLVGDHEANVEVSREAIRVSERFGFALWTHMSHVLHGSARARSQQTRSGALEEVREGLDGLDRIGSVVGTSVFYEMYAQTLIASGAEQGALEALAISLDFAEKTESPFWKAETLRVQGELLSRRGQVEEARSFFEAAIETASSQRALSLELRASASLERLLRSEGRIREADATIESGWERFAAGYDTLSLENLSDVLRLTRPGFDETYGQVGALSDLISRLPRDATHMAQLRQVLREPSPRTESLKRDDEASMSGLVSALTPRRIEVLRLVAKGLTNREIAGVLDISEHTAKAHVAGLLEALDLSNRTEAAVALRAYESE